MFLFFLILMLALKSKYYVNKQFNFKYRYVLQLAIADALFLLTIPFKVHEEIYQSWNLPNIVCVAKEAVIHLNYNASVLFLVVSFFTKLYLLFLFYNI